MNKAQVFISYSGHDAFEASLLQFAIETMLVAEQVTAWTFQRDQQRSEKDIATALKKSVRESIATVFIVSPSTIDGSAAQWMELAYSDAFDVKTFVLLHHLANLKPGVQKGVCASKEMKPSLQYGATYVYVYSGNDGVEIGRFEMSKNDCN